jgi:hypothetical protein
MWGITFKINAVDESFANVDIVHLSVLKFIPNNALSINSIRFVAQLLPKCCKLVAVIVTVVAIEGVVGPDSRIAVSSVGIVVCGASNISGFISRTSRREWGTSFRPVDWFEVGSWTWGGIKGFTFKVNSGRTNLFGELLKALVFVVGFC